MTTQKYLTVPNDEEIYKNIRQGTLKIENKDGAVLFEQELQKINETSSNKEIKKSNESSEDVQKETQNTQ